MTGVLAAAITHWTVSASPPSPPCSAGDHSQHPTNTTPACHEHPPAAGTNDVRDVVVEMQKTITELRAQVPRPGPPPLGPEVRPWGRSRQL